MKSLSYMLAWRFLWFKGKDKNISFMIKTCFLSIFIGTFALMVTLIIMNGFEKVIHEKMQGINADLIITAPGNRLDYDNIRKTMKHHFSPLIGQISGSSIKQIILDNHHHAILFIKGVDVDREEDVTTIAQKIISPEYVQRTKNTILRNLLPKNHILIGHKTAQEQNLAVGDTLKILIPEPGSKKKIFLRKKEVIVGGIFKVGLDEYDSNIAIASLEFVNQLFNEQGVDVITLKLATQPDPFHYTIPGLKQLASRSWWTSLKEKFRWRINLLFAAPAPQRTKDILRHNFPHLEIHSWQELYPDLVSSLILEKYVMFFILALITLVATLNMISLLFMQIQHKLRDIAILKTMGMAHANIRSIFLALGMTLTLLASITGLAAAALVGYILEKYPFIKLPDVYYVSHLPAKMDIPIFLAVFCATLLLGFIATIIPARRTKYINIAQVLRQE